VLQTYDNQTEFVDSYINPANSSSTANLKKEVKIFGDHSSPKQSSQAFSLVKPKSITESQQNFGATTFMTVNSLKDGQGPCQVIPEEELPEL
jgi:hypothetical protein